MGLSEMRCCPSLRSMLVPHSIFSGVGPGLEGFWLGLLSDWSGMVLLVDGGDENSKGDGGEDTGKDECPSGGLIPQDLVIRDG